MITQTEQKIVVLTQAQFNARQSTGTLQEGVEYKIIGESESASNKVTSISSSSTNVQYPSALCVYNGLNNKVDKVTGKGLSTNDFVSANYRTSSAQDTIDNAKEASANKVTSLSSSSTNTEYPSAKCVYDGFALKQDTLTAGTGITITNNTISSTVTFTLNGDELTITTT